MAVWSLLWQDDCEGPTFIFCTAHALQRFLTQAVRFIFGVAPIDYSPVLLLMPFGFHLAMDTLPSGELQVLGFRSALACVRLSLSCPFKLLHTFHLPRPTRHYPRLRIQRSSFERRRDFNPPEQRAAQRTLRTHPSPSRRSPISRCRRLYGSLLRRFRDGARRVSPVARHILVIVLS